MRIRNSSILALLLVYVLTSACQSQPKQMPAGMWEGAQEAGVVDWSMTLDFDACTTNPSCAKVYYVLCAGEFTYQNEENGNLVFRENITERSDQCLSGATVHVNYQGQDKPMVVSWMGDDGVVIANAELQFQDPGEKPVFHGLGQQLGLYHFAPGGYTNFGSFVASEDTLWIPDSGHGKVVRYDIATQKVLAEIQVGDPEGSTYGDPQMVVVSGNDVWVTQCAEKKLARIDPSTNQIAEAIQLDVEPYAIAMDGNTLWVTSFVSNQVLRVDVPTKQVTTIQDIENPLGIALGGGAVWVVEHRTGMLARIDPVSNTVLEHIQLPTGSTPENVIFAEGSVWVANNLGNSVTRIDLQKSDQIDISLPQHAVNISAGGGFVWVALHPVQDAAMDLSKYQIAKVDLTRNQVIQVFDFPGASGSAFYEGILWIDNRNDMSGDKLHAIQLMP